MLKKSVLSVIAVATLASASNTDARIAALKAQMAQMAEKIAKLEAKQSQEATLHKVNLSKKKPVKVKAKVPVLKFSGKHYLGYVSDSQKSTNKFETRRNYFQIKGYFADNPKNYMRLTLDTHHDDSGDWKVRLKYAYLYLDEILPFTGVELGQAHRPWIDYEEHHGWWYRSISKVLVEAKNGAHFTNSADLGVNLKTKTQNFSSEVGIFNGEGYHGKTENNTRLSGEWRLTGHLLGTGEKHVRKNDTYGDISFFGQYNSRYKDGINDFIWYGVHTVYNQPEFLIAAQYVIASDGGADKEGKGYGINGEWRFAQRWNLLGRVDHFKLDSGEERDRLITGITYRYNRNVEFIANYLKEDVDGSTVTDAVMLTAEVNW